MELKIPPYSVKLDKNKACLIKHSLISFSTKLCLYMKVNNNNL